MFISAYRKRYSSKNVLIRPVENWKQSLINRKFAGAVLMDLSEAFNCIPPQSFNSKDTCLWF